MKNTVEQLRSPVLISRKSIHNDFTLSPKAVRKRNQQDKIFNIWMEKVRERRHFENLSVVKFTSVVIFGKVIK